MAETDPAPETDAGRITAAREWLTEFFPPLPPGAEDRRAIRMSTMDRSDDEEGWADLIPLHPGARGLPERHEAMLDSLARAAVQSADAGLDVFASPYPHDRAHRRRSKGGSVDRSHLHADIDGPIDMSRAVDGLGAFIVSSGSTTDGQPHGHVYLRLTRSLQLHEHEVLCKALGPAVGGGAWDDSKVGDNDVLRPTGTLSHKTKPPRRVEWIVPPNAESVRTWDPEALTTFLLGADAWPIPEDHPYLRPEIPAPSARRRSTGAQVRNLARYAEEMRNAPQGHRHTTAFIVGLKAGSDYAELLSADRAPNDGGAEWLGALYAAADDAAEGSRREIEDYRRTIADGWRRSQVMHSGGSEEEIRHVTVPEVETPPPAPVAAPETDEEEIPDVSPRPRFLADVEGLWDRQTSGVEVPPRCEHSQQTGHDAFECIACDGLRGMRREIALRDFRERLAESPIPADEGFLDDEEGILADAPSVGWLGSGDGATALFYSGQINGAHGEPGAAKTWLGLITCAQEMLRGNSVIYLDYELGRARAIERLTLLGVDRKTRSRLFYYTRPGGRFLEEHKRRMVAAFEDRPAPTFAVVDSVDGAMAGRDVHFASDVSAWFSEVPKWIIAQWPELAVYLIDHLPKGAEGDGRLKPIGSVRKLAEIQGAQYWIEKTQPFDRAMDGYNSIRTAKDQGGHREVGTEAGRIYGGPSGFSLAEMSRADQEREKRQRRADEIQTRVLDFLTARGGVDDVTGELLFDDDGWTRKSTVQKRVEGSTNDIIDALRALAEEGTIESRKVPGRGAPQEVRATPGSTVLDLS